MNVLRFLWRASRSHVLTPWRSPYLRWRIETYSGIPAESVTLGKMVTLAWRERTQIFRYLRWVREMREVAEG